MVLLSLSLPHEQAQTRSVVFELCVSSVFPQDPLYRLFISLIF